MKHIVIFLKCLSFFSTASGQSLDVNNISAGIFSNGALFFNGGNPAFEVPKGSGLTTVFASHIWIGHMDDEGVLRVAAQTYAQPSVGGPGFNFGPVADSGAYTAQQLLSSFSRVLKLNASENRHHRLNYSSPNYTPIVEIAQWIGNGDTSKGVSPVLMPYHDTDGSGRYEAVNGDYPVLHGDQGVQVLFSDNRVAKTPGNNRLNINIALQAFAFNEPNDSALNNTIFLRYHLSNVSGNDYDSLYIGNWTDLDIGDYTDDFVGSDSARRSYYAYNATNNDNPAQGGYGVNPPAQAVVFLSHPLNSFVYYNNDTTSMGNPTTAAQKFGYMRGLNLAGQPLAERYMFSGDPVTGTGSNELTLANTPGDRRGLGVMPPISLSAGASVCVDFAYVYGRGSSHLNSITVMRQRIDAIRAWYQVQGIGCGGRFTSIQEPISRTLEARVFPNPFVQDLHIELSEPLATDAELTLYDVIGKKVLHESWKAGQQAGSTMLEVPAGVYILRLQGSNQVFSTRLIKN